MPRPSRWNEIIEAAAEAFRTKGFAATSLEDIASAVGIWKGSLYHYINTKEDLLFAVVREPATEILSELRELSGMDLPPTEKIRYATRSHLRVLEKNFVYASVYLQEIAGRRQYQDWATKDREYLDLLESIVKEGVETGEFSALTNPRVATLGLIGALNWLTHWYRPEGPLRADEIAEQFCDLFLGGLIARSSAPAAKTTRSAKPVSPPSKPRSNSRKTA
jgi:AcrR family transcriptional regulator